MRHYHLYDTHCHLSDCSFQYIIAYPICRGTMVNFVAFKAQHDLENSKFNGPWVCPGDKSEFMSIFRDWESEVQVLLEVCRNSINDSNESSSHTIIVCRQTAAVGNPYSEAPGFLREWECRYYR